MILVVGIHSIHIIRMGREYLYGPFIYSEEHKIIDTFKDFEIEYFYYDYKITDKKIYIYGLSGITVLEKKLVGGMSWYLPNMEYYEWQKNYDDFVVREAWTHADTIEDRQKIYGDRLKVISDLNELSEEDREMVTALINEVNGREKGIHKIVFDGYKKIYL